MTLSLKETLARARAINAQRKEEQQRVMNLPPALRQPASPVATLSTLDVSAAGTDPKPVTEAEQQAMPELLAEVAANIDSPLISSSLSKVLIHIHSFPETRELLRPEDIGLLVRACGKSFKAVVAAKDTRSEAKAKRQSKVAEAEALLADLDI